MISPIAPHCPPDQNPPGLPPADAEADAPFDQFLPGQPSPDSSSSPEDDVPSGLGGMIAKPTLQPLQAGSPRTGIRPGAAFDHFLPDPPPADTTPPTQDEDASGATIMTTGHMIPLFGTDTPTTGNSPAGSPGMTTTGPLPPSPGIALVNNDAPMPFPSSLTNGSIQSTPGNATARSDDSTSTSGIATVGSSRPFHAKDLRRAAADAATPDPAAMAAQMPALVDLRSMVPAVTLTPSLMPPTPPAQGDDSSLGGTARQQDLSVASSPVNGLMKTASAEGPISTVTRAVGAVGVNWSNLPTPGADASAGPADEPTTNQTMFPVPGGDMPSVWENTPMASDSSSAQSLPPITPEATGAPSAPVSTAAVPDIVRGTLSAATPEAAAASVVTDSRLAAPAPAVEAQVKVSGLPTAGGAKIADSRRPESRPFQSAKNSLSQDTDKEGLATGAKVNGTPVAKNGDVVNAAQSAHETFPDVDAPSKRDSSAAVVTPAPGRAGNRDARVGETIINTAVVAAASVDPSGTRIAASTTAADPTPVRQAVRVETLLQNALSVGEGVRPDGHGQMEMRVRLGGGEQDVTVRMQVTNDRMQVTFQTNSPELRKALEHGWQQFSATATQTSTLSLDQPRFEAGRFDAMSGGQGDNAAFSSNQQNARQQEPGSAFGDDFAPALPRATTSNPATANAVAGQPPNRWNGWA